MIWALWVIAGCMIVCTYLLLKFVKNHVQSVVLMDKQSGKIVGALWDIKRQMIYGENK